MADRFLPLQATEGKGSVRVAQTTEGDKRASHNGSPSLSSGEILKRTLLAQEAHVEISRWTLWLGIASVIVSGFGMFAIFFQIRLSSRAVNISLESNRISQEHQTQLLRPHLAIEMQSHPGDLDLWEVRFVNVGQSPAALCEIDIKGETQAGSSKLSVPIFSRARRPLMMTSDMIVTFPGPESARQMALNQGGDPALAVCAITAKYQDIFQNEYRTSALLQLKGHNWVVIGYEYS